MKSDKSDCSIASVKYASHRLQSFSLLVTREDQKCYLYYPTWHPNVYRVAQKSKPLSRIIIKSY